MGKAIIKLTPECLCALLRFPEGVEIVAIKDEIDWHRYIELLISNPEFPETIECATFLHIRPSWCTYHRVVTDRLELSAWNYPGRPEIPTNSEKPTEIEVFPHPETEWTGDFCASVKCPECGKFVQVDDEEYHTCECGLPMRYMVYLVRKT